MKPVYLLGFRGAGKTTLGRALAGKAEFLDMDELWESRNGRSIVDFVAENGIEAFRIAEEELLRELEENPAAVIATGGGIVDWAPSVELLSRSQRLKIYLEVPASELWNRLSISAERRKIGDLHNLESLESLLQKRRPVYEKIATFTVENSVITEALAKLKRLVQEP